LGHVGTAEHRSRGYACWALSDEHKRLALFHTGHALHAGPAMIKEVLNWFDRYLSPVTLTSGAEQRFTP
jgi:hypothetical protein